MIQDGYVVPNFSNFKRNTPCNRPIRVKRSRLVIHLNTEYGVWSANSELAVGELMENCYVGEGKS